jgi:hypothetical protein
MKAYAHRQTRPQQNDPVQTRPAQNAPARQATAAPPREFDGERAPAPGPFGHDFSRVPASSRATAFIQPKLTVSAPGDIYEQEADRAAERVTGTTDERVTGAHGPQLRRACACGGGCQACRAEPSGLKLERLQASRLRGGDEEGQAEAPPVVHEALATPGRPLDTPTREHMESRFGRDFGRVRVHTDAKAAESAEALHARAYTVGQDVMFGAGRYAPGAAEGRRLLAHELTHTLQQGRAATTVQRALKFEIQTNNFVWAVKKTGTPDPQLLPRKYAPTSVGYKEGAGEERGDKPAYLTVGKKGGPARPAGHVSFVEAEGPLVTEKAKSSEVDPAKGAQVVKEYKFKTQVIEKDIIGKPVGAGQLELVSERDNALTPAAAGTFNPNTFEFKYLNKDGTRLGVHLNKDREFEAGHVKFMRVGRAKRKDIDKAKAAQHVEIWKVTDDRAGDVEFAGKMAKVVRVEEVDNAKDPKMKDKFNPNTWEKKYFAAADFSGKTLSSGATPLDVHMDEDGRLRPGAVKFMVTKKEPAAKEQTAIELQSEHGGALEFETPKWFREWSDIEERIQEAVDITKAMNDERGTAKEVTDKKVLDAMDAKKRGPTLGKVVEWPAGFSTAHLTNLRADKRKLLVQIVDDKWPARIQASEGIALSEYKSLMEEHEPKWVKDAVVPSADGVFNTAFQAAKLKNPALDEGMFANLKGFLRLVMTYIVRGQVLDMKGEIAKATFRLMARTNFGSMYNELLSADEKSLFNTLLGDPKKASDNPLLKELQSPINAERAKRGLPALTLARSSPFFFNTVGTNPSTATSGPAVYSWLVGMTKGNDLLRGTGISDAIGAKTVETTPGDKSYKRALFEVRGTVSHGTNDQPASKWVSFAKDIFDSALTRATDTPDDPTTPGVDESSKTGLKK